MVELCCRVLRITDGGGVVSCRRRRQWSYALTTAALCIGEDDDSRAVLFWAPTSLELRSGCVFVLGYF
ncbi:hypothetical protein C2S53_000451 [Perilla frutescens var. hirtella]|uniref:Uncharacterized protein n=1 Tax=Perilla frutescens var. hirtella TaxID=608512 RepID=A0AAD4JGW2_PERFH|nr:hypothetical protein C2S53_000451 [Perilla frutescens var. hirtella]